MGESEAWCWVQSRRAAGDRYPILWPTRLPPNQPLSFSGNHIRVATGGGSNKLNPIVHNDAEIQSIVHAAVRALRIDPKQLRSKLFVTVADRLLIRQAPRGFALAAVDPRNGRKIQSPYLVLGQLSEMPRVDADGGTGNTPRVEPSTTPRASSERATSASSERATSASSERVTSAAPTRTPTTSHTPAWTTAVATFLASRGAPDPALADCLPREHAALAAIARAGAASLPDCAPRNPKAASAEVVFAGWVRARALGDAARASELAADLRGRTRPNAQALTTILATLAGR
jgi:hypothetical protein